MENDYPPVFQCLKSTCEHEKKHPLKQQRNIRRPNSEVIKKLTFHRTKNVKRGRRIQSIIEKAQQRSNTEKQQYLRDCFNEKWTQMSPNSGNDYHIFSIWKWLKSIIIIIGIWNFFSRWRLTSISRSWQAKQTFWRLKTKRSRFMCNIFMFSTFLGSKKCRFSLLLSYFHCCYFRYRASVHSSSSVIMKNTAAWRFDSNLLQENRNQFE